MTDSPLLLSILLAATATALAAQEGVSTMGHARTRHLADSGRLPEPRDVVVEDIVNYHRHRLPAPGAGSAVALDVRFGNASMRPDGKAVLQIGLSTARLHDRSELPPLDLALVVDCSGSMSASDKMSCVHAALDQLVEGLRSTDRVTLVGYSHGADVRFSGRVGDGRELREAILALQPNGSTNLHAGLMLGLEAVAKDDGTHRVDRVILLTDGIANVGVTDPEAIASAARRYTDEGVDLSTIGVGTDLQSDLLATLAERGRGLFHFVADAKDLRKVFVDELQSLLGPVAREVELTVSLDEPLELDRVYGYEPQLDGAITTFRLRDMNHGATQVVLLRLAAGRRPAEEARVRIELRYVEAESGRPKVATADATIAVAAQPGTDPVEDPEVRKNHTIAVLARGMHRMAELCAEEQLAAAERTLQRAIRHVRERYPHMDDPDIRTVLDTAERYHRVLQDRLEIGLRR